MYIYIYIYLYVYTCIHIYLYIPMYIFTLSKIVSLSFFSITTGGTPLFLSLLLLPSPPPLPLPLSPLRGRISEILGECVFSCDFSTEKDEFF